MYDGKLTAGRQIWYVEVDAKIIPSGRAALKPNAVPDAPRTFAAYLHAVRWSCVTSTEPTLFQAPLRAGIVPKGLRRAAVARRP